MKAWLVRMTPPNADEYWPGHWSTDIIPNNPVLLCPLFTTLRDAKKYCLSLENARVVPLTLPNDKPQEKDPHSTLETEASAP